MAAIRQLYFEFMNDLYPYEETNKHMNNNDMLYNLIEIKNDLLLNIDDDDIKDYYNRINTLIDIFKSLGIKPSVIL